MRPTGLPRRPYWRCGDGGVDERARLHSDCFGLQLGCHVIEQHFIEPSSGQRLPEELTWHVVDFESGKHVTIGLEGNPNTISYKFSATKNGTLFSRTVDSPEDSKAEAASASRAAVTHDTEIQSMTALKALVERILANEQKGPYYPPR